MANKGQKVNSKTDIQKQILDTVEELLSGVPSATLKFMLMENFNIKEAMALDRIAKARVILQDMLKEKMWEELEMNIVRKFELYQKALAGGEVSVAHSILKDIDTQRGAYPKVTNKTEVEITELAKTQIIRLGNGNDVRI